MFFVAATFRQTYGEDTEFTIAVRDITFETPTRALVVTDLFVDGDLEPDPRLRVAIGTGLWIHEDGEWRNGEDCAFYGTEVQ